jgi:hypothetical protein
VDRSGPSKNFAAMRHATPDEIFLPGIHWNPLSIDDQDIAARDRVRTCDPLLAKIGRT